MEKEKAQKLAEQIVTQNALKVHKKLIDNLTQALLTIDSQKIEEPHITRDNADCLYDIIIDKQDKFVKTYSIRSNVLLIGKDVYSRLKQEFERYLDGCPPCETKELIHCASLRVVVSPRLQPWEIKVGFIMKEENAQPDKNQNR